MRRQDDSDRRLVSRPMLHINDEYPLLRALTRDSLTSMAAVSLSNTNGADACLGVACAWTGSRFCNSFFSCPGQAGAPAVSGADAVVVHCVGFQGDCVRRRWADADVIVLVAVCGSADDHIREGGGGVPHEAREGVGGVPKDAVSALFAFRDAFRAAGRAFRGDWRAAKCE